MAAIDSNVRLCRDHSRKFSSSMRLRAACCGPHSSDNHKTVGITKWQRAKQGGVGQSEHRAVGTDAERQRQRRDQGVTR